MPEVGQNLGRYTLLKKLAVGGMGEIYLAARVGPLGFAPPVALKVLKDEFASDRQFVDMLIDEANISRFLNHQNVVSVLDFGESDKTYYIAMEYVQGLTLKQLLDGVRARRKPLELSLALFIGTELCRALKYAHTRNNHAGEPLNIVHRDVTPGNVLLSIQGEVKLTDFGIARARGRSHQTQAGVLKGKFGYMAPEMIRYEAIDARADLFCVGVVIYEMVAGCHPVEGASIMEAIHRFEERRIDPPSKFNPAVPKALDVILLRALEPKTSDRWPSAHMLGNALQDLALQSPTLRAEMRTASTRLVEFMRELEPSVFDQPVPKDALDRLLEVGRRAEEEARANLDAATEESPPAQPERRPSGPMRPDSIPPPEDAPFEFRPTVGDHSSGMPALSVDSIPPTFIPSERSGVQALKPVKLEAPKILPAEDEYETKLDPAELGPDESTADEAQTLAMPAITAQDKSPDARLRFPDSSTDRAELRRELLSEPRLPGADPTGPQPAVSVSTEHLDDRTVAMGMVLPSFDSVPPRSPSAASGPVVTGSLEADTDEDQKFLEPELSAPARGVSASYLDDKTAFSPPPLADEDELPTLLPGGDLLQTADRTLLELPDVRDRALEAMVRVRDHDTGLEEPALPRAAAPRDVSASYLDDRTVAGVISTEASGLGPAIGEVGAEFNIPGDPTTVGVVSDDISVDRTLLGVISEPPPARPSAPRAPPTRVKADPSPAEDFDGPALPGPSRSPGRSIATGMPAPKPMAPQVASARVSPAPAAASPGGGSSSGNAIPGAATAQWMAGQLPSESLSWSDDDAARRLLATRNSTSASPSTARPTPAPAAMPSPMVMPSPGGMPTAGVMPAPTGTRPFPFTPPSSTTPGVAPGSMVAPAMTSAYPRPQAPVTARAGGGSGLSLPLILTVVLLFVSVLGLVGITFFTQTFWPRLTVSSEPPGAEVRVDGQPYGSTPLKLKLEPNGPHQVELRLAGYPAHAAPTLNLGFFASEALSHRFERQERRLYVAPVAGTVFVDGQEVGTGVEVMLPLDLDPERPVSLRVEASGYKPWERKLARLAEIGKSLDVPLEPLEAPEPEKPPSGG